MQKSFRLWSFLLITVILIYLAITNRYKITISESEEEVFKYDRWSGKTWRVIPEEKTRFDISKYVIETPQSKEKSQLNSTIDSLTQEYSYWIWQATEKAKLQEKINLMKEIITEMKKLTPQELEKKLEKIASSLETPKKPVSVTEIEHRKSDWEILTGEPPIKRELKSELDFQLQALRKIKQGLKEQ